jgi:hypothetical protein
MKRFLRHTVDQAIDSTDSEAFWVDAPSRLYGIAQAQAQPGRSAQQSPTAEVTAAPISAFPNDVSSGTVTETFAAVAPAAAFPDGASSDDLTQTSAGAGSSKGPSFAPAVAPSVAFPDGARATSRSILPSSGRARWKSAM